MTHSASLHSSVATAPSPPHSASLHSSSVKFSFPDKEFAVEFTGKNASKYSDLFIDALIAEKAETSIQRLENIANVEKETNNLLKECNDPKLVLLLRYRMCALTLEQIMQDRSDVYGKSQRNKDLEIKISDMIKENNNKLKEFID